MAGSSFTAYINTKLLKDGAVKDLDDLQKYISGKPIEIPLSFSRQGGTTGFDTMVAASKAYQQNLQNVTNGYAAMAKAENMADGDRKTSIQNLAKIQIDTAEASNQALQKSLDLQFKADSYAAGPAKNVANKAAREQLDLSNQFAVVSGKAADQLKIESAALDLGAGALKTWGSYLANAIKQTISYTLTIGLVRGAMQQIQAGIQYIVDLNKQMTTLGQITGANTATLNKMASGYNDLAHELGSTTLEVAKASETWIRQGKSAADAQALTKDTIMMSKLAMTDAATAGSNLTAILNGFQMSASQATDVMDKMLVVSNSTKTSAAASFDEISTAMKYSAATALNAGITFQQLESYLAVILTTTQQGSESVGNAMKTLMTRMENIKAGADDNGDSFNNVEVALRKYGFTLLDTAGNMKPLGEMIDELGKKWSTMDSFEKNQIATAIAGVRQTTSFMALMQHYNDALAYQSEMANSAGLANQRYGVYLQGVEASMNKAQTAAQNLWTKTITSSSIKVFYDAATVILDVVSALGGLVPVLGLVAGAWLILNQQMLLSEWQKLIPAIDTIIAGFQKMGIQALFTGVQVDTAFGVIGVAIAAVTLLFMGYNVAVTANENYIKDLATEHDKLTESIKKNQDAISQTTSLVTSYKELAQAGTLNADEQQKFYDIQNKLKELYPELSGYWNAEGNFIVSNIANVKLLVAEKQKQLEIEKQLLQMNAVKTVAPLISTFKSQLEASNASLVSGGRTGPVIGIDQQNANKAQAAADAQVTATQIIAAYYNASAQGQQDILKMLETSGEAGLAIIKKLENDAGKVYDDWANDKTKQPEIKPVLDEAALTKSMDELGVKYKTLADAQANLLDPKKGDTRVGDLQKITDLATAAGITFNQATDTVRNLDGTITLTTEFTDKLKGSIEYAGASMFTFGDISRQAYGDYAKGVEQAMSDTKALEKAQADLLKMEIDVIKQGIENQKSALEAELSSVKDSFAAQKQALTDYYDAKKQRLEDAQTASKNASDAELATLAAENSRIQDVITAEKNLLTAKQAEADFNASIAVKDKSIADLQNQISALMFDTSAAGIAKRKLLEAELAKQKGDLATTEAKRTYDLQQQALTDMSNAQTKIYDAKKLEVQQAQKASDQEYQIKLRQINAEEKAAQRSLDDQLKAIEANYKLKIDALTLELSQTGTLTAEANLALKNGTAKTFTDMIDWNAKYGDGLQDTVTKLWLAVNGVQALYAATAAYDRLLKNSSAAASGWENNIPPAYIKHNGGLIEEHHDGDFAGGLKSNEVFAKLLKGELISTEDQMDGFLKKILPSMFTSKAVTSMNNNGGVHIEMPIQVAGNLDKSVLPDIDKLMDKFLVKLNDINKNRGNIRNTSLNSI